jgi:virginiamycin B lyase
MLRFPRIDDTALAVRLGLALAFLAAAALAAAQSVTDYAVPTAPPTDLLAICLGPDGAVWFGEARTWKVGRIGFDGTITEFSTPGNPTYQMTAGPDGNVWVANGGIGRLTTAGEFTNFTVPPADNGYYDIVDVAAGPDGAVWFADSDGERIGRITPAGDFTFVPVSEEPYAITLGRDGNLWYAATDADVIGRVTPAGVVTTFKIPGSAPVELTAGPDGAIWFGGSGIGRLTTSGTVTTFDGASAARLAPGRDGNVWFTDYTSVSRITPSGEITRFPQSGGAVYDLVYGLDGRVWFTDSVNNRIGRLTLPGQRQPVERPRTHDRVPIVVPRPE